MDPEDAPRPPVGWIGEAVPLPPASASEGGATSTLDGLVAYPQGVLVRATTVLRDDALRRARPSTVGGIAASAGVELGDDLRIDLGSFGFDGEGTEGRAMLALRLADGSWCHEIPYPASATYVGAAPGVFWRSARGGGARWTWEWWIAPLPPASFEVHVSWDEAEAPPLRAPVDGTAVQEAAARARATAAAAPDGEPPERPRKPPEQLTSDDVPTVRVSATAAPPAAAWAEVVAFVRALDLPDEIAPDDPSSLDDLLIMLRTLVDDAIPPTATGIPVIVDVLLDGIYKVVSGGRARPYTPA